MIIENYSGFKLAKKNERERVRERSMEDPDGAIDSNMLWFLISRMRRSARRVNIPKNDSFQIKFKIGCSEWPA